jgi:hypothetical protein
MGVDPEKIQAGLHYAAGKQIREVVQVETKNVERTPPKKAGVLNRNPIKKRVKRVQYKSRGHKAGMKYGQLIWVDLQKFANDVDKLVPAHYDPDYEQPPQSN